jgi:hypothetical protein
MQSSVALTDRDKIIRSVQQWVLIERQLKLINEKTKELRQTKNDHRDFICKYISENTQLKTKIAITGGELRIVEKKEYSPLTFQYIEECLGDLISNQNQIDTILEHIKSKREIKTSLDIQHKEIK